MTDSGQEPRTRALEDVLAGNIGVEAGPQGDLILWPVKDYWIVEALRDELAEKDRLIAEKEKTLVDLERALDQ